MGFTYTFVAVPSMRRKGECCPVWALQHIYIYIYIYIYIRGHDSDSFNPLYTAPVSRKLYIVTPHLVNWQVPPIRL